MKKDKVTLNLKEVRYYCSIAYGQEKSKKYVERECSGGAICNIMQNNLSFVEIWNWSQPQFPIRYHIECLRCGYRSDPHINPREAIYNWNYGVSYGNSKGKCKNDISTT